MSTAIVPQGEQGIDPFEQRLLQKRDMIRRMLAQGTSDDEFELFMSRCIQTRLDPFAKQICAIVRNTRNGKVMTIQVTIDGLRLIADRTGDYAPGRDTEYVYDDKNRLYSATAYVKKWRHNEWHEVPATAHWDEYVQLYNGEPSNLWKSHPHVMLAKCAEAAALRKAFPAETSGLYANEEMEQADSDTPRAIQGEARVIDAPQEPPQARVEEAASKEQVNEIALLCSKVDKTTRELCAELGVRELSDLRAAKAKRVIARLQELANQPKHEVEA